MIAFSSNGLGAPATFAESGAAVGSPQWMQEQKRAGMVIPDASVTGETKFTPPAVTTGATPPAAVNQVLSLQPDSCPFGNVFRDGACVFSPYDAAMRVFTLPAELFGMTGEGFSPMPLIVSAGVWGGLLYLLFKK